MNIIDNNTYFNSLELFPDLKILLSNYDTINDELNIFLKNNIDLIIDYSTIVKYHENSDWKVIPIFGFDKYSKISKFFPYLINLLSSINNVKMVFFSKLGKNTILNPHKGWSNYSNYVLRTQLGIYTPEDSGLWVENKKYFLKSKQLVTFDDSKIHFAFNNDDNIERIVLIIDIIRPENIKKGTSENIIICNELKFFIDSI